MLFGVLAGQIPVVHAFMKKTRVTTAEDMALAANRWRIGNEMNEEVKGGAGSTVESWLEEEGLLEEANAAAIKSVLAWQLREEMRTRGITKTRMAELLHSSPTQVDRILDPDNVGVPFDMMNRAAKVVGRKLRIELV